MKALKDIRTVEDKKAFLSTLNDTPCSEGLDAFFSFEGSAHDYFLTHERGGKAVVWCLSKGMLPQLLTPEVCLVAVQENGYAIKHLTDEQRTPEVCIASVQRNGCAIKYLTTKQRKYVEGI